VPPAPHLLPPWLLLLLLLLLLAALTCHAISCALSKVARAMYMMGFTSLKRGSTEL
jgi:hypothetical protein